jgi:hypothetical protein
MSDAPWLENITVAEQASRNGAAPARPARLEEVVAAFQRWLYLPDADVVLAVLGAVAASRLPGDPVWLLVVAPPGWGKTEVIAPLAGLADVHPTATLTEAALLSGTPRKERSEGATGGLLRQIGERGVILCKDFTSVLSMNRDTRAAVLAALREVYDGSWTRHVGADGGRTLHWEGKVGLVAGVTPVIDTHHAVMGAMGERFVLYRLPEDDAEEQAAAALAGAGREVEQRAELAGLVAGLLEHLPDAPALVLSGEESGRMVALATLAVQARSAVVRDGYSREIELVPGAESPTRLAKMLSRVLAGVLAVGASREAAWRVVGKMALDSIPAIRRRMIEDLAALDGWAPTGELAEEAGYPTTTARRALEDLAVYGLALRQRGGEGKPDLWRLAERTRDLLRRSVPEMSVPPETPYSKGQSADDDFSGTVPTGGSGGAS